MMGGLASLVITNHSSDLLFFPVDEASYRPEMRRVITKAPTLSGNVVVTDWGIPEGLREILVQNVLMSVEDYELLTAFKEDTDGDWVWAYGNRIWRVMIKFATGVYQGGEYLVAIGLSVVSKFPGALDSELS